jgi:hypothetical protein
VAEPRSPLAQLLHRTALVPFLYVISAALILWGIAQVVIPASDQAVPTSEKHLALASMNACELAFVEPLRIRLEAVQIAPAAVFAVLAGALVMFAVCLMRDRFAAWITFAASLVLAGGVLHAMADGAPLVQILCGLVVLAYVIAVVGWTRHPCLVLPGAAPLAVAVWTCLEPSPRWLLVLAGFATLAAGAAISLTRPGTSAAGEA